MHTSMTWGDVQVLGRSRLAIVPNGLPKADIEAIRKNVAPVGRGTWTRSKEATGCRSRDQEGLPVGVRIRSCWTNAMMLGLAYDFTRRAST
jgi:hypothetical protein